MKNRVIAVLVSIALLFGAGMIFMSTGAATQVRGIDLSADTPLIPLTNVPAARVLPAPPAMAQAQLSAIESVRVFDKLSADDSAVPGPADRLSPTASSHDDGQAEPQSAVEVHTTSACNLRAGPGTTFEIVGTCHAGEQLMLVAENAAGDWYELVDGAWIAAFLIADTPSDLPQSQNAP